MPTPCHRAVTEAEAAARQADLPKHRGERDAHPVRLLAAMRTLESRPAQVNRLRLSGSLRASVDGFRRRSMPVDRRRPCRTFRMAVARVPEIAASNLRIRCNSRRGKMRSISIRSATTCLLVRKCQHQRRIGVQDGSEPVRVQKIGAVATVGLTLTTGIRCAASWRRSHDFLGVLGRAAGEYLAVFEREPAERDEYLAMLENAGPCGRASRQRCYRCRLRTAAGIARCPSYSCRPDPPTAG